MRAAADSHLFIRNSDHRNAICCPDDGLPCEYRNTVKNNCERCSTYCNACAACNKQHKHATCRHGAETARKNTHTWPEIGLRPTLSFGVSWAKTSCVKWMDLGPRWPEGYDVHRCRKTQVTFGVIGHSACMEGFLCLPHTLFTGVRQSKVPVQTRVQGRLEMVSL